MPAHQTAVFIDGGYWSAVLRDEFRLPRIDFAKLIEFMAAGSEVLRTYYYNCMPYQSKLEYRGISAADGKPFLEQKRVDIVLGRLELGLERGPRSR